MRTKEELKAQFLNEIDKWFENDVGMKYEPLTILPHLKAEMDKRIGFFVQNRLGHLKGQDFANLIRMIEFPDMPEADKKLIEKLDNLPRKKRGQ